MYFMLNFLIRWQFLPFIVITTDSCHLDLEDKIKDRCDNMCLIDWVESWIIIHPIGFKQKINFLNKIEIHLIRYQLSIISIFEVDIRLYGCDRCLYLLYITEV
jgi:hypothetical protein